MKITTVSTLMILAGTFDGNVSAQDFWTPEANFEGGGRFGAAGISIGDKGLTLLSTATFLFEARTL